MSQTPAALGQKIVMEEDSRLASIGLHDPSPKDARFGAVAQSMQAAKKILVPTDFSPTAQEAFERAVSLARESHATVTLLHVIDIGCCCDLGPAEAQMRALWETASAKINEAARSLDGAVRVETLLTEGLPWEEIVHHSQDFDLLVMAKSRTKKYSRCFSHQTSRRVLERAQCTVLSLAGERDALRTAWQAPALALGTSARG